MDLKLTDLIYQQKNFLTNEQCEILINEYEKSSNRYDLEHCPEANTGADVYSSYKRIVLTPGTEAFRIVHDSTETMIRKYHEYTDKFDTFHIMRKISLKYSLMYRLLKYETGTKIHPHVDHDPYVYGSCTFNLNDDYEGGDFMFFKGKYKVQLKKGEAMIWPADYNWVHEVDEITSGVRYSANSFLISIPSNVYKHINNILKEQLNLYETYSELKDPTEYNIPFHS